MRGNDCVPLMVISCALALLVSPAWTADVPPDGPWSGHVRCRVVGTGGGNDRQESQTWTLTGDRPLRTEGAMRIYAATWSGSGQGSLVADPRKPGGQWSINVPPQSSQLAIFLRASDGKLIFRQWGVRAELQNAVSIKQTSSPTLPAREWDFGWIDASSTQTVVTGSKTLVAPALPAPVPAGAAQMVCEWQFTFGNAPPPAIVARATSRDDLARKMPPISTPTAAPPPPEPATLGRPVGLPAPTDLKAQVTANQGALLTWTPVAGASGYRIEGSGIDQNGLTVSANGPASVMVPNVPNGPSSWSVVAVDSLNLWDAAKSARVSAMVRGLPAHSPAFLTKNNGAGGLSTTLSHYAGACGNRCQLGATFFDVVAALGISRAQTLGDTEEWGDNTPRSGRHWIDFSEAEYQNVTEFNSRRQSRCWNAPGRGNVVCYANSQDHGLSLIYLQPPHAWFMLFEGPPDAPVFDIEKGGYDKIMSLYKLVASQPFDAEGRKFAPHVCLACHGGRFDPSTARVTGATLLPIDPARITGYTKNVDLINRTILESAPPAPVAAFIQGLYGGNALDPNSTANRDYIPSGWVSQAALYRGVVRPYCIACHLNTPQNIDFSTAGKFMALKNEVLAAVCGTHSMPHAAIAFRNFWTNDTGSVYLPGYLSTLLGGGDCR